MEEAEEALITQPAVAHGALDGHLVDRDEAVGSGAAAELGVGLLGGGRGARQCRHGLERVGLRQRVEVDVQLRHPLASEAVRYGGTCEDLYLRQRYRPLPQLYHQRVQPRLPRQGEALRLVEAMADEERVATP